MITKNKRAKEKCKAICSTTKKPCTRDAMLLGYCIEHYEQHINKGSGKKKKRKDEWTMNLYTQKC